MSKHQMGDRSLHQYFTPEWAAIEIVETFFPDLTERDLVIEPGCGRGAFLKAIPAHVNALGIEIDPVLAEQARRNSGREVWQGNFCTMFLGYTPTVILGNPPFEMSIVEKFLGRSQQILGEQGRVGFILPCSTFQTPSRVLRWNESWSLLPRLLPRTLFPRSKSPLVFMLFTKDKLKRMYGFALYEQCQDVSKMRKGKTHLVHGAPGKLCWRVLVEWSLEKLGGEASLKEIYQLIEPRRNSTNRWWKEKVRQQLQEHFKPVKRGVWSLN